MKGENPGGPHSKVKREAWPTGGGERVSWPARKDLCRPRGCKKSREEVQKREGSEIPFRGSAGEERGACR